MSWRTSALSFVLAAALTAPMAVVSARPDTPKQQTGQTQPAPQQQRPVFRGGVNLILVDAYPRDKNGRVVEGLGPDDFDITEDGKPQKVDQFEFVRIEPVPESERRDPNNTRDMLQQAADPHNRVFVVYLDSSHVTVAGSHEIRGPLISLLNNLLAPNDMFGVLTPKLPVTALVLGRKTTSIEDQLTRYWPWGQAARLGNDPDDPDEDYIDGCAANMPEINAAELKARRRESRTIQSLSDLTTHLGKIREARSTIVIVTAGWVLFRPNEAAKNRSDPRNGGPPPITITNGRLGTTSPGSGYIDASRCTTLNLDLLSLDDEQRFRDLIDQAKKSNVVFYPINPEGLEAPNAIVGMPGINQRTDALLTLADNTDGKAIVNTNDLNAGVARIVTDLSAYYLIGYYSTNAKQDGRLRQIKVTVKEKDIKVSARRSYLAPNAADAAALSAARASVSTTPTGMTEAVGALGRLDSAHGLLTRAIAEDGEVAVVAELSDSELAKWAKGADVTITVTEEGGTPITVNGHIDAGARSVLVRGPVPAGTHTWQITAKIAGDADLVERTSVRTADAGIIGQTLIFRGTPAASSPLRPVADQLFRRNERVHLEWAIKKPLENRAVRLLDQRGQPLAINVTATEREVAGKPVLAADLSLAPLSPSDYVLELTATAGGTTDTRYVAIRVIR